MHYKRVIDKKTEKLTIHTKVASN